MERKESGGVRESIEEAGKAGDGHRGYQEGSGEIYREKGKDGHEVEFGEGCD